MFPFKRRRDQAPKGSPFPLEIQIHSASIQRGVRYLWVQRRHALILAAAAVLLVGLVGYGLGVSPSVVSGLAARAEYRGLIESNAVLNDRLQGLTSRFEELAEVSAALELNVNKVYLAYGLDRESLGQGGFPLAAPSETSPGAANPALVATSLEVRLREQALVLDAFLREVKLYEQEHLDQVRTTPSICPLRGDFLLTSPFGQRRNPFTKASDFHAGIDLSAQRGLPVYAPCDGRVVFAGRYSAKRNVGWSRYGNLVRLHSGEDFVLLFGHLDEIKVRQGQQIKQGDLIGTVGNTGWSTNPHLHYEVRRRAGGGEFKPVDPRVYILDHRWRDEEQLLVRARSAPEITNYEPLPRRGGE